MSAPAQLQAALHELLGDARLVAETLPDTELRLWLIDAANMDRAFSPEETRRILDEPPYWCFCWASGLVLARWLAERPDWVRGKRVLDFGAGSGVAAIAAAKAGAAEVVACDLDPLALAACRANAALNGVELRYSQDFFGEADRFDLTKLVRFARGTKGAMPVRACDAGHLRGTSESNFCPGVHGAILIPAFLPCGSGLWVSPAGHSTAL